MNPAIHTAIEKAAKSGHYLKLGDDASSLLVSHPDTLSDDQRFWLKLHKQEIIDALHHQTGLRWLLKHCGLAIASNQDFYMLRNVAASRGWVTRQDFIQERVGIHQNPMYTPQPNETRAKVLGHYCMPPIPSMLNAEQRERYEERAAVLEYQAGMQRDDAEQRAWDEVLLEGV